ncbi:hypothetical protein [Acrocarpospora sp. B8E8]|uniref:hypothetical protein n=1 Tax=Acrocarpospora sp. B8E8 TaxID=3153572 RepID=UPI00325CF8C2
MRRSNPKADPDWLGTFTSAHYVGGVMHALYDLGDATAAEANATDALDLPSANARTRALHTVLHASVLAGCGELDGACHTAGTALDAAATLKSKRLNQRLAEFAARLALHRDVAAVADYLDFSDTLLGKAAR